MRAPSFVTPPAERSSRSRFTRSTPASSSQRVRIASAADGSNFQKMSRFFRDSAFEAAETYYRKVVDASPQSMEGHYNLAGSLMFQNKAQESMQELETASKMTEDKDELHKIYHNAGVLLQSAKEYKKAIEAYKESLRNDPSSTAQSENAAFCMPGDHMVTPALT